MGRRGEEQALKKTQRRPGFTCAPAALLAAVAVLGVVVDRVCCLPTLVWSCSAILLILAAWGVGYGLAAAGPMGRVHGENSVASPRLGLSRLRTMTGMLATGCLAAGWHHVHWRTIASNDLVHLSTGEQKVVPVLLNGIATTAANAEHRGAEMDTVMPTFGQRTRFGLQVNWLWRNSHWESASGKIWVHVSKGALRFEPGDQITVCGNLSRYRPPMNPGERDFLAIHRSRGEHVYLRVPVSDCVRVTSRSETTWRWCLARLRSHWLGVLRQELAPSESALAGALLLGERSDATSELREHFVRTGMAHLLAVSGLHVGILAAPWLMAVRARLVPLRLGLWGIVIMTVFYSILAGGRAPVVRACVLIQILCFSWMTRRRASFANSLGLAALSVLVLNPTEVFNAGTQLSFLAVAALVRAHRLGFVPGWLRRPEDPLDRLVWRTRPWWHRTLRSSAGRMTQVGTASCCVWLVTAPLVVETFHVLAPIAVPLNLLLCLPLTLGLQAGFGMLLLVDICPWLARSLVIVCQSSLQILQHVVRMAESWPASHVWLVGAGPVAVGSCYLFVICAWVVANQPRKRILFYALAGLCLVAGWSEHAWQRHQRRGRLSCTVLSVGHGTCVVLQMPDGQVWLYDAGRRGSIRGGVDAVSRFLWQQGISGIDVVLLSHADVDHYSLVPGLIERFPVKRFLMGQRPLRMDRPAEAWLAAHLRAAGIQPQVAFMGQRWQFSPSCAIKVLHPPSGAFFLSDNAESVVLGVEYHDVSILLPGDLESEGIESLLARRSWTTDVVMAPHHGSPHSDPRRFLQWCRPAYCVISGGDDRGQVTSAQNREELRTRILHTGINGAIEIRCDARGIQIIPFRS